MMQASIPPNIESLDRIPDSGSTHDARVIIHFNQSPALPPATLVLAIEWLSVTYSYYNTPSAVVVPHHNLS